MTDHANELRRHARKIPYPQGETPGVMLRAADEIERLRGFPWRYRDQGGGALAEPDAEEDSEDGAGPLRMGARRLQPERGEPADGQA